MKITIITAGSRGDFEPYIALGKALTKRGHQVTMPASRLFEGIILENGLEYRFNNSYDTAEVMKNIDFKEAAVQRNKFKFMANEFRKAKVIYRNMLHSYWKDCQGSDAIISTMAFSGALSIARKLGIPCFYSLLIPIHPTVKFPSPMAPEFFNIGLYNKISHKLVEQMVWQPFRSIVNDWHRTVMDLKPEGFLGPFRKLAKDPTPLLCGFSPSIIPEPEDWPDKLKITGSWSLEEPEGWEPPSELESFLKSGEPPIYIGFGSMLENSPEKTTQMVCEALQSNGQRGLISSGWSGLGNMKLPDNIMQIGSIPHSWLFARMKAIVHHGGAGTTHASLRSGVPTIVTPFLADQPFWANRVYQLGCGPKPIPYAKLTPEKLARLIQSAIHDEKIKETARIIGAKIREEDGKESAARIVEHYLRGQ